MRVLAGTSRGVQEGSAGDDQKRQAVCPSVGVGPAGGGWERDAHGDGLSRVTVLSFALPGSVRLSKSLNLGLGFHDSGKYSQEEQKKKEKETKKRRKKKEEKKVEVEKELFLVVTASRPWVSPFLAFSLGSMTLAQAREKWDAERKNTKRGKFSSPMPAPPTSRSKSAAERGGSPGAGKGGDPVAAWENGVTYLPPDSKIPTLKNRAAAVAASCIDRAPEVCGRISRGTHIMFSTGHGAWMTL